MSNIDVQLHLRELSAAGRFEDIERVWSQRAASLRSDQSSCQIAAAAFAQRGRLHEALAIIEPWARQLASDPSNSALAGRILVGLGRADGALIYWERAVRAQNVFGWWLELAECSLGANQPEVALRYANPHRLTFNDECDPAYLYTRLLTAAARSDEALIEFERILGRWPHHPKIGPAYAQFVCFDFPCEAMDCLSRTHWRPDPFTLTGANVRAALATPAFFDSDESALAWRTRLVSELQNLTAIARSTVLTVDSRAVCLDAHNFFAAYTELDVTDVQCAWGDFVEALVAPMRDPLGLPKAWLRRPVKRVGFVSNRVNASSAGRLFNGWIAAAVALGLDVHAFVLGELDEVGRQALAGTKPVHFADQAITGWRSVVDAIMASKCDLLVFPEPQGSPLQQLLAGLKLAPLQAAACGNPVTTGSPAIDFFLSPVEAESANGAMHYREQLIRLRGMWNDVGALATPSEFARPAFGFKPHEHIYLVTQPMFKWTPRFRRAIVEILRLDPEARLAYVHWALAFSFRAFECMLRKEFIAAGLNYGARVTVSGQLKPADYLALYRCADVALDTFGFSGGISTADALSVGCPVITLRGTFLRGRQSACQIESHGWNDNVVDSFDAFVSRAMAVAMSRRKVAMANNGGDNVNIAPLKNKEAGLVGDVAPDFAEWLQSLSPPLR